jgi:hypothetical protein
VESLIAEVVTSFAVELVMADEIMRSEGVIGDRRMRPEDKMRSEGKRLGFS